MHSVEREMIQALATTSRMSLSMHTTYTLAHSQLKMPCIALGVFQSTSPKQSVSWALAAGYRHIDTARFYHSEAVVADAVRASGLKREECWITTKIQGDIAVNIK